MFTVRQVLELPVVRRAAPELLCGAERLDRAVRWAHVIDVADADDLLEGGELVLCHGIGMGSDARVACAFVRSVAEQRASALAIELGLHYRDGLPDTMRRAAAELDLPLVALHRPSRFVEITQAVLERIMTDDLAALREAEDTGSQLTSLLAARASLPEVLNLLAGRLRAPVLFEDERQRLLAWSANGRDDDLVLRAWRGILDPAGSQQPRGWLAEDVPMGRRRRGRLIALDLDGELAASASAVLARGAQTLALAVHRERDTASAFDADARNELLARLCQGELTEPQVRRRLKLLGIASGAPVVAGVMFQHGRVPAEQRHQGASWIANAIRRAGWSVLAGVVDDMLVVFVSDFDADDAERDRLGAALRAALNDPRSELDEGVVVLGEPQERWLDAAASLPRSIRRARSPTARTTGWVDAAAVELDDLFFGVQDRGDLRAFVDRRLGTLVDSPTTGGRRADLLPTLRAYIEHGGRKADAARALHIERQSLYNRLARLEELLGLDLDDGRTLMELHVALAAHRFLAG